MRFFISAFTLVLPLTFAKPHHGQSTQPSEAFADSPKIFETCIEQEAAVDRKLELALKKIEPHISMEELAKKLFAAASDTNEKNANEDMNDSVRKILRKQSVKPATINQLISAVTDFEKFASSSCGSVISNELSVMNDNEVANITASVQEENQTQPAVRKWVKSFEISMNAAIKSHNIKEIKLLSKKLENISSLLDDEGSDLSQALDKADATGLSNRDYAISAVKALTEQLNRVSGSPLWARFNAAMTRPISSDDQTTGDQ